MEFVPTLVLAALVKKCVDTVRLAQDRKWRQVGIQVAAWAFAVGLVMLAAHSDYAPDVLVGSRTLEALGWASQVLVGLALGSTASVIHDVVSAPSTADTPRHRRP